MAKSKVGAEPNRKVKHLFTKDAGIHEGIHRDEPGWYVSFPLDRTTVECMKNHLIHLHSGKTIEAVGMTDI